MDLYSTINQKLLQQYTQAKVNHDFTLDVSIDNVQVNGVSRKYILQNYKTAQSITISEQEAFIWLGLDSGKNFTDIYFSFIQTYKSIPVTLIKDIFHEWQKLNIIFYPNTVDVYSIAKNKLTFTQRLGKILSITIQLSILPNFSKLFYKFAKPFLNLFFIGSLLIVSTVLITSFLIKYNQAGYKFDYIPAYITYLIALFSLVIHEFGHGLALVKYNIFHFKSGIKIDFFVPYFFIDTTLGWVRTKKERIIIASGGIIANIIQAGIASGAYFLIPNGYAKTMIVIFIFINLTSVVINLLPFIKLDGYYILSDLLSIPYLQERISNFVLSPKKFLQAPIKYTLALIVFTIYLFVAMYLFVLFYTSLLSTLTA